MKLNDLKNSTAIAILSGGALATGWYVGMSAVLSNVAGSSIPAVGAIGLASIVPALMLGGQTKQRSRREMGQRFEALDRHVCINIVNEDNIITEVNEQFLKLTGYSRDELLGKSVGFLYEASLQDLALEIRGHLKQGKTWQGETPLLRKDGSVLYTQSTIMPLFNDKGDWAGSISARTDVTKTNELIAERHTAQTLYELNDDIWIIDSETEAFSYLNRAAKGRLGQQGDEYRGKSLEELTHDKNAKLVLEACRALRSKNEVATQFETKLMGVSAEVSIKFLPSNEGAGRYLILFNDISNRIEQEERKSAFISTVSHELRSPLTSIKGAMGLLLSRSAGDLPEKARSLLEIAHRNADRLVLIINDILDLDKISNGQMEFNLTDVDVAELVAEADQANAMLQRRFGVNVQITGASKPIPFHTDPNRFIQLLTNLLSNAYKFSDPNDDIVINVQDADDHIRVSVKDQGPGIPVDEQHKIFDRFADMTNSDRPAKGGTGLGLSICKAIVENLGGTIGFDTEVDVGTTFYFTLPKKRQCPIGVDDTCDKRVA